VIHTASETNVDRCEKEKEHAWKTNVEGTRNIALACQEVNAKLAYISTDYVFDGEKGNYSEDEETNPINYYGLTKLESEKQVAQHCQDYIVLRTSVLYGWHPWKQNFVTWTIDQLRKGKEIAVVDDQLSSPTLADNLAEMSLEASLKNLTGVYHASGSERINRYDVARKIADIFDLDSNLIKPIRMSQLINWVARRPRDSSLNTGKIRSRLSAKPLNVTEGLQRMKEEEMR
jgi:dTDP-4-dehydrorhamnose reductase